MKWLYKPVAILSTLFCCISAIAQTNNTRQVLSFDNDWKFFKGDFNGAEQVAFNDVDWRSLSVPHDWSIEGPYDRNNNTGRGGGYCREVLVGTEKHFR